MQHNIMSLLERRQRVSLVCPLCQLNIPYIVSYVAFINRPHNRSRVCSVVSEAVFFFFKLDFKLHRITNAQELQILTKRMFSRS